MKAIGGYFELELPDCQGNKPYHSDAVALNSGRNALKLILQKRNVSTIYIPYYICEAVLEPIESLNINYKFYYLNKNLEIEYLPDFNSDSYVLYVNYFGLKGNYIAQLSKSVRNLIIDNSQAFYDKPVQEIDTFYSPRKFFGVPDGGYVYGPKVELSFKADVVYDRCQHLLIRSDVNAERGYEHYQANEDKFVNRSIRQMSTLSQRILSNVDYKKIKKQRIVNYNILHDKLRKVNALNNIADLSYICPLAYPLLNKKLSHKQLHRHKIYVPKYWSGLSKRLAHKHNFEHELADNLIALPIDQRYSKVEMYHIIDVVLQYV